MGKTFEALAVIKYYELRNDRVLVLCPKRLRDNWTIYTNNDRRNSLARDRFHYDVLNHTDLSRDDGLSGDIDLTHVNWGNYDLVVIDESDNFRNKASHKTRETRYGRLMDKIIKAGVRTRVLMLDRLRRLSARGEAPDVEACARHDRSTREGRDMDAYQSLLAKAIASIRGTTEERAVASLFTPGGTRATKGDFVGIQDFEVVSWFIILPAAEGPTAAS